MIEPHFIDLFMYSFMIRDQEYFNKASPHFQYNKYKLFTEGLETIVKRIYPKVFEIFRNSEDKYEFRNIKFESHRLETDGVYYIDNGYKLTIVIGEDCPQEHLKRIFGISRMEDILELCYIPEVFAEGTRSEENRIATELVEYMRSCNELYYLPLSIIRHDSHSFEMEFGRYLYAANSHKKFFKHLLMLK